MVKGMAYRTAVVRLSKDVLMGNDRSPVPSKMLPPERLTVAVEDSVAVEV
jgi:hypothetical protein